MTTLWRKIIIAIAILSSSTNLMAQRPTTTPKLHPRLITQQRFQNWGNAPHSKISIQLDRAWQIFHPQKEVVVAIVDTGIDPHHPFLKNNLYLSGHAVDATHYGHDFSFGRKSDYMPMDNHGHGTHIAGIIKGIFPQVKIMALKYYNPQASGQQNLNSTIAALRYAVYHNVDIINYSGGGPEPAAEERAILEEANRRGILVVAAAGNEESNIDQKQNAYYPASYALDNIITVTAYDQNLQILPSSNYGSRSVDIAAPGNRIKSSLPFNRAGFLTGTSQATAFVSGVAALLKAQRPELSVQDIKRIIKITAHKELTMMGKCAAHGRLDAAKALAVAKKFHIKHSNKQRIIANRQRKNRTPAKIYYRAH